MRDTDNNGVFITGTDTGVGKTIFAGRLIEILEANGLRPAPRKPAESGCRQNDDGALTPADATQLAKAMKHPPPLEQICGFRFAAAASPAYAAKLANTPMTADDLAAVCAKRDDETLVVEGAGGLLSPLADKRSNADLIRQLGLPIFLVVADKLGCINHTLLSLMAADALGIETLAIILNRLPRAADAADDTDNFQELQALTDVPIIRMEAVRQHAREIIALIGGDDQR